MEDTENSSDEALDKAKYDAWLVEKVARSMKSAAEGKLLTSEEVEKRFAKYKRQPK